MVAPPPSGGYEYQAPMVFSPPADKPATASSIHTRPELYRRMDRQRCFLPSATTVLDARLSFSDDLRSQVRPDRPVGRADCHRSRNSHPPGRPPSPTDNPPRFNLDPSAPSSVDLHLEFASQWERSCPHDSTHGRTKVLHFGRSSWHAPSEARVRPGQWEFSFRMACRGQ